MGTPWQESNDQAPVPGGDPDQPNDDVPQVPIGQDEREPKVKDKTGYGHIGNREQVPLPEGAPKPHQIFGTSAHRQKYARSFSCRAAWTMGHSRET